ncbi:MAG: tellurite-like stress resistance cysteine protease StiP [Candidatus Contendobacter sp.]|nr:tellurite-like stress resistance cysteine protease StiP [Candidatus Contendobacter sp.]MDG4557329.1 tellurite-like stress resistance cysteine protease StiP [Candidatus Contendobacter sp.]
MPFSGSYQPEDTVFLLKPMALAGVDVATKERWIQSGQRHYSELLTPEQAPNPRYLALFEALTARYARRLATEIMALARHLVETRPQPITVASLARAGTPVGALLARALRRLGRTEVRHYSLSIIRDRGIDENALKFILRREGREPAGLVFVDGWTAKGVIAGELRQALRHWNARQPERLDESLHVVSDIGGVADVAATDDDYAIPSGILNATVSGLTSRSILNAAIGPDDFHGCVFYTEFAPHDRSLWFLDQVTGHFADVEPATVRPDSDRRLEHRRLMREFLARVHAHYRIADRNFVKPGVAEATRVLLRRLPDRLLLREPDHPDVEHLWLLAEEKRVPVVVDPAMPIQATALIKDLS